MRVVVSHRGVAVLAAWVILGVMLIAHDVRESTAEATLRDGPIEMPLDLPNP